MLAASNATASASALLEDPAGVLAVLLAILAVIFWLTQHPVISRVFKVVPALVFCYFVPTALTTAGVLPDSSPLYSWVKTIMLPACLLLLVLSLDIPGILRLGPKALVMLLAGTAGVVIGGPIALLVCAPWLPEQAWQVSAPLAGSWIGGAANMTAIKEAANVTDAMLSPIIIVDVFVANIWMGILLVLSGRQEAIDKWTGANAEAIRDLERRMTAFQERTSRIPTLPDLLTILALGFGGAWVSYKGGLYLGDWLVGPGLAGWLGGLIPPAAWKYIIVTAIGIVLSFTRARNLEGAGASRLGSVMIYLLVACIGAGADFRTIVEDPSYILMGFVWMACHITVLLVVARLVRAPLFFVAVGSQANIGGAASAPVVASAFHPSLAAVGALLAVAGYVLGTYAGLVCMGLLKWAAGAGG
ncbi:MAG: DUF819 family protein [bacterium]|nr:DUF819 family protein [bacterium]